MALITCPKCGKQFSDRAEKCPQCGSPISRMSRMSNTAKNVVSIASLALLLSCIMFIISSISLSLKFWDLMGIFKYGLISTPAWYNANIVSFLVVITTYFFLQWNSSPLKEYKNITFIRFVFSSISLILICIEMIMKHANPLGATVETLEILLNLSLLIMGIMSIICSQKLTKPLRYYVVSTEIIMLVVFAITNCYLPLGLRRITITGLYEYFGVTISLTFQLGMVICIFFILLLFNRQYFAKVFKFQ